MMGRKCPESIIQVIKASFFYISGLNPLESGEVGIGRTHEISISKNAGYGPAPKHGKHT